MAKRRRRRKTKSGLSSVDFTLIFVLIVLAGAIKILSLPGVVSSILHLFLWVTLGLALFLTSRYFLRRHNRLVSLRKEIEQSTRLRNARLAAGAANPRQLDPYAYEEFCAAILENKGWTVELTRTTGDFGADVLAKKEDNSLVIQCKQWSQNVGVKAVQEVYAAQAHYGTKQAIVVTETNYTTGAQKLASSTGVWLFSSNDLINLI